MLGVLVRLASGCLLALIMLISYSCKLSPSVLCGSCASGGKSG